MPSWSDHNHSTLEGDIAEIIDDFDEGSVEAGISRQLLHDPNVSALTVAQAAIFHRKIEPALVALYERREREFRAEMIDRLDRDC